MSVLLIKLGKEDFDNIVVERNDGDFIGYIPTIFRNWTNRIRYSKRYGY